MTLTKRESGLSNEFYGVLSGDTAAQIFWLKNRMPKKWQDKPEIDSEDAMVAINALVESNKEVAQAILNGGQENDQIDS